MPLSTAIILLLLAVVVLVLCAWLYQDIALIRNLRGECTREHERAEQAIEHLHAVSDSALRGFPAVQWRRLYPVPEGADAWYWRVRVAGEELLLTDEQYRVARQRADHLLPAGREVTTRAVAKSEAPAGGAALQPTA